MKLLNFTIIKLTGFLIIGIVISYFYSPPYLLSLSITAILLVLLVILFLLARNRFTQTIWFGVMAYLLMLFIGILSVTFHNQKNFPDHYSKLLSNKEEPTKNVVFRIREVLKPGTYNDKYIIDILEVNNEVVSGKSLLNIKKDSVAAALKVDEIILSNFPFETLKAPLNPHQFNYKKYLEKQYIYHQVFAENKYLVKISSHSHTFFGFANNVREHINLKLKNYPFSKEELAVINALLLGQRQDISSEVYNNYINAGAVHILAVSGLHVGIVLIILSVILKPLNRFKHGKLLKTILMVSCLWSFALIAGLSASVTRAVTMFSIVAIAMNLKRPTNIYNTLAISIFAILLFKPLFLFDVGFQLSYLAVFSIVAIDPRLYELWKPKNWLLDKYWHTLTVTLSAQLGIIPISLYYFNQFPSLFFLSNLVIIPVLGIVLGLGILVILLATTNLLPHILAEIYGVIISSMNVFVSWVSKQEWFILKDIAFNLLYVLASYLIIFSFVRFITHKNFTQLKFLLVTILIFQFIVMYTTYIKLTNTFIIFHKHKFSILGNLTKNNFVFAHDCDSVTLSKTKIIRDYTLSNHIKNLSKEPLQPVYFLNDKTVLIIDSLGVYNIKTMQPDYVVLRQSPKINLNRLIDSIRPKHIIADGSNYNSYIEKWESICLKRKLPFHHTGKKGAYTINY